jgi:hypothetical protein
MVGHLGHVSEARDEKPDDPTDHVDTAGTIEKFCSSVVVGLPRSLIPNLSSGLANAISILFHSTSTPLDVERLNR